MYEFNNTQVVWPLIISNGRTTIHNIRINKYNNIYLYQFQRLRYLTRVNEIDNSIIL